MEMEHVEPHHTQENPAKLQEYLPNTSDSSTNPERAGQPLKTHQKGMHSPAQDAM